ncbi:helix-turn-helix transcriptional regulator [Yersinia enterocolitica]
MVCFTQWFYKLIQDGKFSASIKPGPHSRWLENEVAEWINNKVMMSRNE